MMLGSVRVRSAALSSQTVWPWMAADQAGSDQRQASHCSLGLLRSWCLQYQDRPSQWLIYAIALAGNALPAAMN
jgi:hypothetical protein